MAPASLADLVELGLLQPKPADSARVRAWHARSTKDLGLVAVLREVDDQRAMAVAYEAGYRACAGIVDLAGHRVTSQPGHHRAAIDAATVILGDIRRPLLRRLDRARRFRNETLYGEAPPVAAGDLRQLVRDVSWLLEELNRRLREFAG